MPNVVPAWYNFVWCTCLLVTRFPLHTQTYSLTNKRSLFEDTSVVRMRYACFPILCFPARRHQTFTKHLGLLLKAHARGASYCQPEEAPRIFIWLQQGWRHSGVDHLRHWVRAQAQKLEAHWPVPRMFWLSSFVSTWDRTISCSLCCQYVLMCVFSTSVLRL
jgi:hypothetical protein